MPMLPPDDQPTREELAASIGCRPEQIIRFVHRPYDGKWISFVEDDENPAKANIFETVWPEP